MKTKRANVRTSTIFECLQCHVNEYALDDKINNEVIILNDVDNRTESAIKYCVILCTKSRVWHL